MPILYPVSAIPLNAKISAVTLSEIIHKSAQFYAPHPLRVRSQTCFGTARKRVQSKSRTLEVIITEKGIVFFSCLASGLQSLFDMLQSSFLKINAIIRVAFRKGERGSPVFILAKHSMTTTRLLPILILSTRITRSIPNLLLSSCLCP